MLVLGIESSCDETGAAVVTERGDVLSDVVQSQVKLHAEYGGVVSEESIDLVASESLQKLAGSRVPQRL